jgi:chromosome segregation ATPase
MAALAAAGLAGGAGLLKAWQSLTRLPIDAQKQLTDNLAEIRQEVRETRAAAREDAAEARTAELALRTELEGVRRQLIGSEDDRRILSSRLTEEQSAHRSTIERMGQRIEQLETERTIMQAELDGLRADNALLRAALEAHKIKCSPRSERDGHAEPVRDG